MTNSMRAELALCFVGLFLSCAAHVAPGVDVFALPLPRVFAVLGAALSLVMMARLIRRRRADRRGQGS